MCFFTVRLSVFQEQRSLCAAFADICLQSLGDKHHLVYQDKHVLYPHKAAMAVQAEISLPGEAAGEIPKKKAYEQRLESGGCLSRLFSKKMIRQSSTGDIPTWSSKAAEGFMFLFFKFYIGFFSPTSHKIHVIILPDHFVKILYL